MKAENLPFADGEFELASAIEVLEHVPDPEHTVAEMARVAPRHLLVSVPREPLWRGLNIARGSYMKELGNTPGHLNHWSRALRGAASSPRRGRGDPLALPVDHAAGGCDVPRPDLRLQARRAPPSPGARATARRGSSRSGSRRPASSPSRTSRVASYALDDADYKSISLLWSLLFVIVSVIYRPIEQLLSRTIAERRARGFETAIRCGRRC